MTPTEYYLSETELESYRLTGYVGPLNCSSSLLYRLPAMAAERGGIAKGTDCAIPHPDEWAHSDIDRINLYDPHLLGEELMGMCSHPSLVAPVTQLLESEEVMLVHTRLRVKFAGRPDRVPWHQDVAHYDAGLYPDGYPIPSVSAWIALGDVPVECGPLSLIPGTFDKLHGDWRKGFDGLAGVPLESQGVDEGEAVVLPARAMEYYLFNSWNIHRSLDNISDQPRVAFVMRFVHPRDAIMENIDYVSMRLPSM